MGKRKRPETADAQKKRVENLGLGFFAAASTRQLA